jgi:hypothetical protein
MALGNRGRTVVNFPVKVRNLLPERAGFTSMILDFPKKLLLEAFECFVAPFSEKQGAASDPSPPSASVCDRC